MGQVCAEILVRRGFEDPTEAARFLAADERYPLEAFEGLADAATVLYRHASAGSRIVVHGDYDCDGVCATATLIRALRQVGADASWFLPAGSRTATGWRRRRSGGWRARASIWSSPSTAGSPRSTKRRWRVSSASSW